ncbi:hypothetical protein AB1L88_16220 [Tautonia sp. JC769]|uniref:hypothetical protein n=1 Tax=Tautonia sp. JC769 TaxID=3232135 RepID=UPI00345B203B
MSEESKPGEPPTPSAKQARAARRHHRSRMIARAKRSIKLSFMSTRERERFARKAHDHLASCSCWMCGNPRRWFGEPTRQERRAELFQPLDPDTDR